MSYVRRAARYADSVIAGDIPACLYVKQACERFLADLERDDLWLDHASAEWRCKFLERLPHVKGKWAATGEKFALSDWQVFVTVNVYGWRWTATNKRRFREVYVEVPRKNGKSFWVAGLAISHLCDDSDYGSEVYCGATSEKQAWEVFRPAKQICERTPALRSRYGIEVNAKTLNRLVTGDRFEPVIGKPGDGSSPSLAIADEFHEHADSDQVDTFITGMGAREEPLMVYITTAGADMGGPCYAKRDDVRNILQGTVVDDSVFGIIYTIDEGDDWTTEEAMRKANPNLGVSVNSDFLLARLQQARRNPREQAAYKTKHLNQWVGAKAAWMNMLAYQACRKKKLSLDDFVGRKVYIGVDLAATTDIASIGLIFPPQGKENYAAFCRHYLPEDKILDGNTRYQAWHASGDLIATPGNVIDYEYIEKDIQEIAKRHQIVEVPFDPWNAVQFSIRMQEQGFPMVQFGQSRKNMNAPMKEMEALILKRGIDFTYDPVLFWMFGNVVAHELMSDGTVRPIKEKAENKIDGVMALLMALGRILLSEDDESVYEKREMRIL